MRHDSVFTLDGSILTLAVETPAQPFAQYSLIGRRYFDAVTVRVIVDEPLTEEEQVESIETFESYFAATHEELIIGTKFMSQDGDDEDEVLDHIVVPLSRQTFRVTLHSLIPGPLAPAKLDKERLETYYKRTHPGEPLPSWFEPQERPEKFYVGLIVHLESAPLPEKLPSRRLIRPGKNVRKPDICPPGLLSDNPDGWERYFQSDLTYTHKISQLLQNAELIPLSGDPVRLAVRDLILPYWIAWICGETHPRIVITAPPSFAPEWPGVKQGIKAVATATGWEVDIEGMNARFSQFGHLRQVAALCQSLPDGAVVQLDCAADDSSGPYGRQRYRGPVTAGQWLITETYPAMQSATLVDMLELVRQGETGLSVRARDEREAGALATAIQKKDFLLRQDPPTRKGLVFALSRQHAGLMPFLVARALAARYPRTLPLMDRDDKLEDWDNLMNSVAAAGARWATGEAVFEGRFATYTRTDLASASQVDHARIAQLHGWLVEKGFVLLGDLHSTQTFAAVFRGYALPDTAIYSDMVENGFGSLRHDFYTRFADGFSLTTADSREPKPVFSLNRNTKTYRHEVPGGPEAQWQAHQEKLPGLVEKHGAPIPVGDLAAFAREIDDYFIRTQGIPRRQ